jgi:hypothetical protein
MRHLIRRDVPTYHETMLLYGRDVAPVFRAVAHGVPLRRAAEQVQRRNERILVARERGYAWGVYYGELYPKAARDALGAAGE